MGKKKPPEPKNDFAGEENLDVCSFSENPIIEGKCIATFSFSDNTTDKINESAINISNNNLATSESASTKTIDFNNSCSNNTTVHTDANTNDIDNFNSNIANITEIDRNSSRSSTVRKLNELKSLHPYLNTYVSTLVDLAIAHYYEHIINQGGTQ